MGWLERAQEHDVSAYLAVGGGALIFLAIIGLLIWLVIREARAAQAARDANATKDQTIAKKQAEIVAEHRDPDRVTDRLRDGTF